MKDEGQFTVIVADDEEELREAVCKLVPWEEIGFRLIGSAGNGLDALQLVEQFQPDLLLTDIRMPFISGTELAKQVRELQPLIQVVFLSGYDDFEYAQRAIDYNVISYLLKPISTRELTDALREIHKKMEARFNELKGRGGETGNLAVTVASLLLDNFAEHLAEDEICRMLIDGGFVFTAPYRIVVLATYIGTSDTAPQDAAYTVDQVMGKYYRTCSVGSGQRVLTLLISEDDFSSLVEALDELYYVVKRLVNPNCVIGASREYGALDRCYVACREAVDAQRFSDESGIHHISKMQAATEETVRSEQDYLETLEKLLYSGSRHDLEKHLAQGFAGKNGPLANSDVAAMQVLIAVQNVLNGTLKAGEAALVLKRCGLSDPFSDKIDRGEFKRRVVDLCVSCHEILEERKRNGVSFLCDRTLRIIDQNYMNEELSLGSVSEELHVSPNYLSANMKKYTGDTFINLLIKRRMEAALSLLTAGNMKIAEVAIRCGYSDQHYFSYCFKKYYGVSPAKMRRGEEKEGNP